MLVTNGLISIILNLNYPLELAKCLCMKVESYVYTLPQLWLPVLPPAYYITHHCLAELHSTMLFFQADHISGYCQCNAHARPRPSCCLWKKWRLFFLSVHGFWPCIAHIVWPQYDTDKAKMLRENQMIEWCVRPDPWIRIVEESHDIEGSRISMSEDEILQGIIQ